MKTLRSRLMALLATSAFALLSACGGGGGDGNSVSGGGDAPQSGQNGGSESDAKIFAIGLANIEVRRASNGDALSVDESGITSDTLTLVR